MPRAIERTRELRAQQAEPITPSAPSAQAPCVSEETRRPPRANGAVKLAESFLAGNPVTGTGSERFQVMIHLDQGVLEPDLAWTASLEST